MLMKRFMASIATLSLALSVVVFVLVKLIFPPAAAASMLLFGVGGVGQGPVTSSPKLQFNISTNSQYLL